MEKFIKNFQSQLEDIDIELYPDMNYVDSEFWDSLTAATVQMMIEDEYGVKVGNEQISSFKSLEELYKFVQDNSNGGLH